jgi:hypothetical protein
MALKLSTALAIAQLQAACDAADGGELVIYQGTAPASVDTPISTEIPLVVFTLDTPSFEAPASSSVGATAEMIAPAPAIAATTGTAQFFRIFDAGGDAIFQGGVSDSPGSELTVASTAVVSGVSIAIVEFKLNQPV